MAGGAIDLAILLTPNSLFHFETPNVPGGVVVEQAGADATRR
jgi:hypothetical protein